MQAVVSREHDVVALAKAFRDIFVIVDCIFLGLAI